MIPDRTPAFLTTACALVLSAIATVAADAQELTLIAAGDIEWSRDLKLPDAYYDLPQDAPDDAWIRVPYLYRPEAVQHLTEMGVEVDTMEAHHNRAIRFDLSFGGVQEDVRYPFQRVTELLREADIAFANLENPLSDKARQRGAFRAPVALADALRWAGIDVVSIANNHALDAEEQGLFDTMEALWKAGVGYAGGGVDLDAARRPFIIEREGIRFAFLAYTQFVNGGADAFAISGRSGVLAMDPLIIKEDIQRVRDQVDHVVVSLHWGVENTQETHPDQRTFAQEIIDAGAELILGHHPHVPRGIEVYNGGVIIYSFGNLIFGHGHDYWLDNYITRFHITKESITQVDILPISGTGSNLAQPFPLAGEAARAVLDDVRARSAELDTSVEIQDDLGVIHIDDPRRAEG